MATTRDRLHELLDTVPDDQLDEMEQALAALAALTRESGTASHALDVPEDDEPVTIEDLVAIARGHAAYERGDAIPDDQLVLGSER